MGAADALQPRQFLYGLTRTNITPEQESKPQENLSLSDRRARHMERTAKAKSTRRLM